MFAATVGQRESENPADNGGLLGILGDLLNRGETLDFTNRSGAYETDEIPRSFAKLNSMHPSKQLSVARAGHEIYTRRARTGYVHTTSLGARLDTRG